MRLMMKSPKIRLMSTTRPSNADGTAADQEGSNSNRCRSPAVDQLMAVSLDFWD